MRKVDAKDWDAQDYRNAYPNALWRFNPWTGMDRDFGQDPYGLALPDEDGIYNPVAQKMEPEAKEADYRPDPMRFVRAPVFKHVSLQVVVGDTSAEVIGLLSQVMATYPNITNAERGAVVSWFCERYRN